MRNDRCRQKCMLSHDVDYDSGNRFSILVRWRVGKKSGKYIHRCNNCFVAPRRLKFWNQVILRGVFGSRDVFNSDLQGWAKESVIWFIAHTTRPTSLIVVPCLLNKIFFWMRILSCFFQGFYQILGAGSGVLHQPNSLVWELGIIWCYHSPRKNFGSIGHF